MSHPSRRGTSARKSILFEQLESRYLLFSTPIHQGIIATELSAESAGLGFLRDAVIQELQDAQVTQDNQNQFRQDHHFDGSHFLETSQNIAAWYDQAVAHLDPDVLDSLAAAESFGKVLHAVQDFYSHTNWVELQRAGLIRTDSLLDESIGRFPSLNPYSVHAGGMIVQGEGAQPLGPNSSLARSEYVVMVNDGAKSYPGVISGSVHPTFYGDDATPDSVAVSHGGLRGAPDLFGSLAKTDQTSPLFEEAFDLASAQTVHEFSRFCRLVNEAYAEAGEPNRGALALIESWVQRGYETRGQAVDLCGIVDSPPTARDDFVEIRENETVLIDVLANDTDLEGNLDPTTVYILGGPYVTGNNFVYELVRSTGVIRYKPPNGFVGETSIRYDVQDTSHGVSEARVTINVVDDPSNNTEAGLPSDDQGIALEFYEGLPADVRVISREYTVRHSFDYKLGVPAEHVTVASPPWSVGFSRNERIPVDGFDSFGGSRELLRAGVTSKIDHQVVASTNGHVVRPPLSRIGRDGIRSGWWISRKRINTTNRSTIRLGNAGDILNQSGTVVQNPDLNVHDNTEVVAAASRLRENYVELDSKLFLDATTTLDVLSYSTMLREYGTSRFVHCCAPPTRPLRTIHLDTQDGVRTWIPSTNSPYVPDEAYKGTFEYSILVHFAYVGNATPVARDDRGYLDNADVLALDVLANDTDADGFDDIDPRGLRITSHPEHGNASIDPTSGRLIYEVDEGFVGTDSLSYVVADARGSTSNAAVVSVEVGLAIPGDANHDGLVGFEDFLTLSISFGTTANAVWEDGDFNSDGRVSFSDFIILSSRFAT